MICVLGVPVAVHWIVMVSPASAVTSFRSTNTDGGTVEREFVLEKYVCLVSLKIKVTEVEFVLNIKDNLTGCNNLFRRVMVSWFTRKIFSFV